MRDHAAVKASIKKARERAEKHGGTRELALRALSCLDHTSLNASDTAESVKEECTRLTRLKKDFGLSVGGFCTWPVFAPSAGRLLMPSGIPAVAVGGGFPFAKLGTEEAKAEIAALWAADVPELDIVFPRELLFAGDEEGVTEYLNEARRLWPKKILKVIVETAELASAEQVYRASTIALEAGADFIKTSTGKSPKGGATLELFMVMIDAALSYTKKTGRIAGLKPAGGMRSPDEALHFLLLASEEYFEKAGAELSPRNFRLGSSSLLLKFCEEIAPPARFLFEGIGSAGKGY